MESASIATQDQFPVQSLNTIYAIICEYRKVLCNVTGSHLAVYFQQTSPENLSQKDPTSGHHFDSLTRTKLPDPG